MRFSRVDWIDNLPNTISPPSSPSTLCQSPRPSPSPSTRSLSPSDNPDKRQRIDTDWEFLTSPEYSFSPRRSLSPSSEDTQYPLSLQSAHHPKSKLTLRPSNTTKLPPNPSAVTPNNSATLQSTARLTRNQAHQQGIVLPPISSYLAYTNTLPLLSLLSATLPLDPIEPQSYQQAISLENPDREKWIEAMRIEVKFLLENETWELIIPPPTVRTLSAKWVFGLKRGIDGEITRF